MKGWLTPILAAATTGIAGAAEPPAWRASGPLPEPALFGEGVISTGEYESHPCFTPDGRTLYFVRSTPQFTDWKIFVTRFADGAWSKPEPAPFSGTHRDAAPFITADGAQLWFISDRPVEGKARGDMDIWVMDRAADGSWGEPRTAGAPLNSTGNEWFPTLASSGTIYFGSDRPGGAGATDLYCARVSGGKFGEPENLGSAINSEADDFEGCIAPDEGFLVFMSSGRSDSRGGGDLYLSRQLDGKWEPARNLGPVINRPGLEISAYLSPDGKYFFFSSGRWVDGKPLKERPKAPRNGLGDIYFMDLEALLNLAKE